MYMTGISWHHSGSVEKARQNFNQALEIALDVRDEELIFLNQLALVELLRVEGQYQQVLNQIEPLKVAAEASKKSLTRWIRLGASRERVSQTRELRSCRSGF